MKNSRPVKVQLVGGLGNQLFCYAFGKFIASKGHSVVFDTSEVDRGYTKHGVSLESLSALGPFVNFRTEQGAVRYFLRRLSFAVQARLGNPDWWPPFLAWSYTASEVGWSNKHIYKARPGRTMRGYFASHKYFLSFADRDSEFFDFRPLHPSDFYLESRSRLSGKRFLAVHVRRGDYVGLADQYGLCGPRYFEEAIHYACSAAGLDRIVVFSDDIETAKGLLPRFEDKVIEFITPPKDSGAEESFLLMRMGSAFVISNSSFSLWAALTAKAAGPIVYPSPWHKGMETPRELIPLEWTPIPSDFL